MSDRDGKTEDASPKKLQDAREKGQVAKSGDLNVGIALLVFTISLDFIWRYVFKNTFAYMRDYLSRDLTMELTASSVRKLALNNLSFFLLMLLPVAAIAIVVGIVSNLVQVGFLFNKTALKPDFKKLNPIQGFKNIFSKKSIKNLIKNLIKLFLVFKLMFDNLTKNISVILSSGNIELENLFDYFLYFLKEITLNIAVVVFILGVVDYFFERREHKNNLKMTKEEVKEEFKQMEGNQEVKAARKQRQREMAMGRMMSDIGDSTVVVTNPSHISVAIRYDEAKDEAPIVLGKGKGHIAMRIREEAKEKSIPLIENKALARQIYRDVDIGETIPSELYQAVAEILVVVYQLEEERKGKI